MRVETHLTAGQCDDVYERLMDRILRAVPGGTRFGVPWPTIEVFFPSKARVIRRLFAARKMQRLAA